MQNLGGGGGGQTKCIIGHSKIENGLYQLCDIFSTINFLEETLLLFETVMNPSPHIAIALLWCSQRTVVNFFITERQQLPKLLLSKCLHQS